MSAGADDTFRGVLEAAHAEAARLRSADIVSAAYESELDARFEAAARRALRVPTLAERSARLRRIAKRVVPASARPMARRGARLADRAVRDVFEFVESRLGRGR